MPTTVRVRPCTRARNTLAPEPAKSQTLKLFSHGGHQLGAFSPQPRRRASGPAPRKDQRGLPVRRSNATTELKYALSGKQASLQPPGAAARHAVTDAGCAYSCPAAAMTRPLRMSMAGGLTKAPPANPPGTPSLSGRTNSCQTIRPVRTSSAIMLPRKINRSVPPPDEDVAM
ncbi:hypothetical protein D3C83_05790 [compost metagenome]